jgi:hypothetical protein
MPGPRARRTAAGGHRVALQEAALAGLADQLEREATRQQEHGYTEDRAAFVEKRPARFQGR